MRHSPVLARVALLGCGVGCAWVDAQPTITITPSPTPQLAIVPVPESGSATALALTAGAYRRCSADSAERLFFHR